MPKLSTAVVAVGVTGAAAAGVALIWHWWRSRATSTANAPTSTAAGALADEKGSSGPARPTSLPPRATRASDTSSTVKQSSSNDVDGGVRSIASGPGTPRVITSTTSAGASAQPGVTSGNVVGSSDAAQAHRGGDKGADSGAASGGAGGAAGASGGSLGDGSAGATGLPPMVKGMNEGLVHRLVLDPTWRLPAVEPPPGLSWDSPPAFTADGNLMQIYLRSMDEKVSHGLFSAEVPDSIHRRLRRSQQFWAVMLGVVPLEPPSKPRAPGDGGAADDSRARPVRLAISARRQNLLNAFREVAEALAQITPSRPDLLRELKQNVDLEHWARLMRANEFGREEVLRVVAFLGARIKAIEAPVHNASTQEWLNAAFAFAQGHRESNDDERLHGGSGASDDEGGEDADDNAFGDCPARFLPRVVAWLFFKIDQLRVDVANYHLMTLAPLLRRGGTGARYEREKFEALRVSGQVGTEGVEGWLAQTVDQLLRSAGEVVASGGSGASPDRRAGVLLNDTQRAFIEKLQVDDRDTRLFLSSSGVLQLLVRPVALSRAAYITALRFQQRHSGVRVDGELPPVGFAVPETLRLDIKALESTQNDLQRIALTASLTMLLRGLLAGALTGIPRSALARVLSTAPGTGHESADPATPEADGAANAGSAAYGIGLLGVRSLSELRDRLDARLRMSSVSLESIKAGVAEASQLLARSAVGDPSFRLPAETMASITSSVESLATHSHVLFSRYLERCVRVLRLHLNLMLGLDPSTMSEAVRPAPVPDPLLTPGLEHAQAELRDVASSLARIVMHQESAFGGLMRETLRSLSRAALGRAEPAWVVPADALL